MSKSNVKKNTEQIKSEISELSNGEYELIGKYINSNIKIAVRHLKCSHEYSVMINNFRQGRRCPQCNLKSKTKKLKYSHEQFLEKINEINYGEYILLEEYRGSKQKIKVKHKCGYIFNAIPHSLLKTNKYCRNCLPQCNFRTHDEFEVIFNQIKGLEYTLLEKYSNSRTKIKVRHNNCGYEYKITPSSLLSKNGCKKCSGLIKITEEEILMRLNNNTKFEKEYLIESVNVEEKSITVIHKICNYKYNPNFNNLLLGLSRCPKCFGNYKRSQKEIEEEIKNISNEKYELVSIFEKMHEKIKIKHLECSYIFETTAASFIYQCARCPFCLGSRSNKEKEIENFLNLKNINFKTQYKIKNCKNIRPLPFDFAIFNDNNDLVLLIEYNGEQHYKSINHFGGQKKFKKQIINDQIKLNYCKDNNINLLVIPHQYFLNYKSLIEKELYKNE